MRLFRVFGIGSSGGARSLYPTVPQSTRTPESPGHLAIAASARRDLCLCKQHARIALGILRRGGGGFGLLGALDHGVDDAVFLGLLGGHVKVAVGVALDAFERLAGVLSQDFVETGANAQDLARFDLDVARLARAGLLRPRLMD